MGVRLGQHHVLRAGLADSIGYVVLTQGTLLVDSLCMVHNVGNDRRHVGVDFGDSIWCGALNRAFGLDLDVVVSRFIIGVAIGVIGVMTPLLVAFNWVYSTRSQCRRQLLFNRVSGGLVTLAGGLGGGRDLLVSGISGISGLGTAFLRRVRRRGVVFFEKVRRFLGSCRVMNQ